jgi:hypothetical protein
LRRDFKCRSFDGHPGAAQADNQRLFTERGALGIMCPPTWHGRL